MAIAALVLGIVSVVIALFFAGLNWLGAVIGIIGIIFGALGKKDPAKKGMATAGLVLSVIGVALGLITYLACVACVGSLASIGAGL